MSRIAARLIGLVIGLAAAGVTRWRGFHRGSLVIAAIAVTIFIVTVASARLAKQVDAAFATFARVVGAVLTFVLLVVQFYLVVLPAGLLERLRGRRTITTRFDRAESTYWTRVAPHGELPSRTYMKDANASARRSPLLGALGFVALLVLVDIGAGALLNRYWLDDYRPYRQFQRSWGPAPAMRDAQPWFEPWLREWAYTSRRTRYEPHSGWKRDDYAGTYVNIENGVRRSWQSPRATQPGALRIWIFGGSTMWGDGARDEHTIPSELARILDARGIAAEVVNHAEAGWSQWEERLKLESLLASGARADIVVFYDGGNEHINQVRVGGSESPMPMLFHKMRNMVQQNGELMPTVKKAELVSTLIDELEDLFGPHWVPGSAWKSLEPAHFSATIARIYLASVEMAAATAQRYGIEAAFFWQPWYPTTTPGDREDAAFLEPLFTNMQNLRALCRATTDIVRRSPLVHDISNALDDVKGPRYIDVVHVNEQGNREIAQQIYVGIEPQLRKRLAPP